MWILAESSGGDTIVGLVIVAAIAGWGLWRRRGEAAKLRRECDQLRAVIAHLLDRLDADDD